jgi:hypothetical protein
MEVLEIEVLPFQPSQFGPAARCEPLWMARAISSFGRKRSDLIIVFLKNEFEVWMHRLETWQRTNRCACLVDC